MRASLRSDWLWRVFSVVALLAIAHNTRGAEIYRSSMKSSFSRLRRRSNGSSRQSRCWGSR